jgi:hypothetical protein
MGCDIHMFVEMRKNGVWGLAYGSDIPGGNFSEGNAPFNWRSYRLFGFLAGVRNYSEVTPISKPRGLPEDVGEAILHEREHWGYDGHSTSWLTVKELADFNYNAEMEDRRCTVQTGPNSWSGSATCKPGEGEKMTYREFLGERFFKDLEILKAIGNPEDTRIVFWFDN